MGNPPTKSSYVQLLEENIVWLKTQEQCLENIHIQAILQSILDEINPRMAGIIMYKIDEYGIKEYNNYFLLAIGVVINWCIIFVLAQLTLSAEIAAEGSKITNIGDAIWLMTMSASTIGFGDLYPVTAIGRVFVTLQFYFGMLMIGFNVGIIGRIIFSWTDNGIQNRELRKQNADILRIIKDMRNMQLQDAMGVKRV